jgi:hypothetical protein
MGIPVYILSVYDRYRHHALDRELKRGSAVLEAVQRVTGDEHA